MREELIDIYENSKVLGIPPKSPTNSFKFHFVEGAFIEISGPCAKEYRVLFTDQDTNQVLHESFIKNNMWTRTNRRYFTNWLIQVYDKNTGNLEFEHKFNPENKKIYIHIDSKAMGDTLTWFPYIEEFRKKHKCQVVCSTFHNDWFEKTYKDLEFITPSTVATNLYAMYTLGWFYNDKEIDLAKNPQEVKTIPLAQTATDILGLEYTEIKPKISFTKKPKAYSQKYVCIAPHASAHAKYWNYPGGWQTVVDWLNDNGYKVLMVTHEMLGDEWHDSKLGGTLKKVINKTGNLPFNDIMNHIYHADAFIGVSSGLSWMSWALGTKSVLISGFSEPYTESKEFIRLSPPQGICSGCFNREWLNPGDWEWCPDHKDTPRHFECTKSITPNTVITSLKEALNIY